MHWRREEKRRRFDRINNVQEGSAIEPSETHVGHGPPNLVSHVPITIQVLQQTVVEGINQLQTPKEVNTAVVLHAPRAIPASQLEQNSKTPREVSTAVNDGNATSQGEEGFITVTGRGKNVRGLNEKGSTPME